MNLPQAIEAMQLLLAQGRYADAHRLVLEQLASMPKNPLLLRWKQQIEAKGATAGAGEGRAAAPPEAPRPPAPPPRQAPQAVAEGTVKAVAEPAILVVGGSPELGARCRQVLAVAGGRVVVRDCAVARVATMVASWRPVAIVLTEDVYFFDPSEFDALAKDVGATLVRLVDEYVPLEQLASTLAAAVTAQP